MSSIEKYKCRDICPLPQGCAESTERVETGFLRTRNVIKNGKIIGDVSVLVEPKFEGIAQQGVYVLPQSPACQYFINKYQFVMDLKGRDGVMGGTTICNHTKSINWSSGGREKES